METRRWTNPTQPQTLQYAVFLLYISAVFGILMGNVLSIWGPLIGLGSIVAFAAGGFGIANEMRWGYKLGVGVALAETATFMWIILGTGSIFRLMLPLMFSIALLALLLHPHSREYQKIWFS